MTQRTARTTPTNPGASRPAGPVASRAWCRRSRALGFACAIALALLPSTLAAQGLALKRELAGGAVRECPATPVQRRSGPPDEETTRLVERGQEAALVGDHRAARDAFREAARRAPAEPGVAYQLARAHEELGETAAALREYCRYLVLAPGGGDEREVRARVSRLAGTRDDSDPVLQAFRSGVAAFDRRDHSASLAAFANALSLQPGLPEAHFNRALAYEALARRAEAATEFERYLGLRPGAGDAGVVRDEIDALRRPAKSQWTALGIGLVVPGGGQFYTGHPVQGIVVLGAVAGGVYYALAEVDTVPDLCGAPPGRRCYVEERPNLTAGLAVAGAVHVGSALYSMWQARRVGAGASQRQGARVPSSPFLPQVTPRGAGALLHWRLRF